MCEQCTAEVDEYDHPLDGWLLVHATHTGNQMKRGDWGLVECNDPTFVWSEKPIVDPSMGVTDDNDPVWGSQELEVFTEKARSFDDALVSSPADGWRLYNSCIKAGYDRDKHGRLSWWLFDYLARWLQAHPQPSYKNRSYSNALEPGDKQENAF